MGRRSGARGVPARSGVAPTGAGFDNTFRERWSFVTVFSSNTPREPREDFPLVVDTAVALRGQVAAARAAGLRVGVVPTMGALHAGHLSLVDAARAECGLTIVTIFVNPAQFGPHEDFQKYPRTLEADLAALAGRKVDLVFAPTTASMYAPGHATYVEIGGVAEGWEGASRPGHFRGVATIVLKLFQLCQADVAYFGQKDYQQCQVVAQMARDFDLPIELRICPIVREPDGLALSSRNVYLSAAGRQRALVLSRSLRLARELLAAGHRDVGQLTTAMRKLVASEPDVRLDYLAIVDPVRLTSVERLDQRSVALVAARVENTRLIDNEILEPPV